MASEEQINLSDFIKKVHKDLRAEFRKTGEDAWSNHLQKSEQLTQYAEAMKTLSEDYWNKNSAKMENNRIAWTVTQCSSYFSEAIAEHRKKEETILNVILNENIHLPEAVPLHRRMTEPNTKLRLLDVGSCFNPFQKYSETFDVIAVDIAPSKGTGVLKMDFLNANITDTGELAICHNRLRNLPQNYFDCVVFSLLLEYMPASKQRLQCIKNAYEVLDNEGILVIITPDSKHAGANAKLMKNWRYTLALYGFRRIKFEKLQHVTCMVFRKAISQLVTERWARIHKEPYMSEELNIPQDFQREDECLDELVHDLKEFCDLKNSVNFLDELPGCS